MCFTFYKTVMPAIVATGLVCMTQAARATVQAVQLYPQTIVEASTVRLSDLAVVEGFDAAAIDGIREIVIGEAPAPGEADAIDVEQVREALAGARVNLAAVCIGGAASCTVYRPAAPQVDPVAVAIARKDGPVDSRPHTVEQAVRKHLAAQMVKFQGQVEVNFGRVSRSILNLGGADVAFHVRPRAGRMLGLLNVDVDIVEAGKPVKTVPVLVEAALLADVVVARRPINRGAMVRPDDVCMQQRRFTRIEDVGVNNTAMVVGRAARRYVRRGEMVTIRDVEAMPLVRRGDYVTVWFRSGGLSIRGSAKALAQGVQGERIEVKAEPGGQVYAAVVTGPKTVDADPAGGGELLSRAD